MNGASEVPEDCLSQAALNPFLHQETMDSQYSVVHGSTVEVEDAGRLNSTSVLSELRALCTFGMNGRM